MSANLVMRVEDLYRSAIVDDEEGEQGDQLIDVEQALKSSHYQ